MATVFEGMNQLDSASFYEEKAIEAFHKVNHEEPLVYQTLGDIAMKSGSPGDALSYYEKSLQLPLEIMNAEPQRTPTIKLLLFIKMKTSRILLFITPERS